MVKNRLLLLGSVAFGVSFSLSLLVNRNIKTAFLTGLITVPATFSGLVVVNRIQRTQRHRTLTALQTQIHRLKKRETQLNQFFSASATEKQRAEANLNFLKSELSQLYIQTSEQRSYQQQLTQDLTTLEEHRDRFEVELQDLKTQIQNCEQRREKLYDSLQTIKAERQNVEDGFNFMLAKLKQLQVEVAERQYQKEELERNLAFTNKVKLQLEENLHNLRTQIQELEIQKLELNQSLPVLGQEKHATKVNLHLLQPQFPQLQGYVIEKDHQEKVVKLSALSQQDQKEADEIVEISAEWTEFLMRLPKYELQVLKAIAEQDNPKGMIKNIAEENITMPELLIDLINKRALNTIGDLIIEPGNESFYPKILEEYLVNVKKVIKIKEMN